MRTSRTCSPRSAAPNTVRCRRPLRRAISSSVCACNSSHQGISMRLFALLCVLCAAAGAATQSPRVVKTINRDWTFHYAPQEAADPAPAAPGFDDSHWPAVAVPHTWSTYEATRELHPFIRSATEREDTYWWYGWGWYRKRIAIGKQYEGQL